MKAELSSFSNNIVELRPVLKRHWEEFGDGAPLSLRYEVYFNIESEDKLLFVALKEGDKLVGHFTGFVMESLHTGVLTLTGDSFFILPEYRNKNGGNLLFNIVEEAAAKYGVKKINIGIRAGTRSASILKRRKYVEEDVIYSKWI